MHIREYKPSDWDAVCAIYDLSKPDEFKGQFKLPLIPPLNDDSKMKPSFHASKIFVAERADVVVGFSGIHGNTVSWLFVHPLHRRALIAETLLQRAIAGVQGNIELNVLKSNEAAVRLYEKLGFNVLREVTGSFNGQDCQVLRLRLTRGADQTVVHAG